MRCSFTKHSGIFLPSFWRSWVKREDVLMAVVSNQFSYFECQLLCSFICFFFPLQIYLKNKDLYTVEANNPRQLVEIAARDIEKLLSNRSKALVVSTNWLHFLFTIKIHTYICIFESRFFFFFPLPVRSWAVSAWYVQDMTCRKSLWLRGRKWTHQLVGIVQMLKVLTDRLGTMSK